MFPGDFCSSSSECETGHAFAAHLDTVVSPPSAVTLSSSLGKSTLTLFQVSLFHGSPLGSPRFPVGG